jgi:hypothetical protein
MDAGAAADAAFKSEAAQLLRILSNTEAGELFLNAGKYIDVPGFDTLMQDVVAEKHTPSTFVRAVESVFSAFERKHDPRIVHSMLVKCARVTFDYHLKDYPSLANARPALAPAPQEEQSVRRSKHVYSESDDSEDSESDDERERRRRRRGKKQRKDKKQRSDKSGQRAHKNKEGVQPEPQEIAVMEFTPAQRNVLVQFLLQMQEERMDRLQDIILTAVDMEKSFARFKTKDDEMECTYEDFNDKELSTVIHVCRLKNITPPQL